MRADQATDLGFRWAPSTELLQLDRGAELRSLLATRLLARMSGIHTDRRRPQTVRDLWLAASVGSLVAAQAEISASGLLAALGCLAVPLEPGVVAMLLWGQMQFVTLRGLLASATPGGRLTAAGRLLLLPLVLFALVPCVVGVGAAVVGAVAGAAGFRILYAYFAAASSLITLTLAGLAFEAIDDTQRAQPLHWQQRPVALNRVEPSAPVRAWPGQRQLWWLGALRDDLGHQWPALGRIVTSRAWLVLGVGAFAGVAAFCEIASRVPGQVDLAAIAAVAWASSSIAVVRHQAVIAGRRGALGLPKAPPALGIAATLAMATVSAGLFIDGFLAGSVEMDEPPLQWILSGDSGARQFAVGAVFALVFSALMHFIAIVPPRDTIGTWTVLDLRTRLLDSATASQEHPHSTPKWASTLAPPDNTQETKE